MYRQTYNDIRKLISDSVTTHKQMNIRQSVRYFVKFSQQKRADREINGRTNRKIADQMNRESNWLASKLANRQRADRKKDWYVN